MNREADLKEKAYTPRTRDFAGNFELQSSDAAQPPVVQHLQRVNVYAARLALSWFL